MAVQWRAVGGAVVGLVAGIRDAVRRRRAGRRPQLRRAWVERCVGGWCIRRSDGLMYVGSDVPVQWHPLAVPTPTGQQLSWRCRCWWWMAWWRCSRSWGSWLQVQCQHQRIPGGR